MTHYDAWIEVNGSDSDSDDDIISSPYYIHRYIEVSHKGINSIEPRSQFLQKIYYYSYIISFLFVSAFICYLFYFSEN
jgi:hypothetical protein